MRISIDASDRGSDLWSRVRDAGCHIFLDGKELRDVITADEEDGYILKYKEDDVGNLVSVGNEWQVEELRGDVRIVVGSQLSRNVCYVN